jgi:hypothetical protein
MCAIRPSRPERAMSLRIAEKRRPTMRQLGLLLLSPPLWPALILYLPRLAIDDTSNVIARLVGLNGLNERVVRDLTGTRIADALLQIINIPQPPIIGSCGEDHVAVIVI